MLIKAGGTTLDKQCGQESKPDGVQTSIGKKTGYLAAFDDNDLSTGAIAARHIGARDHAPR